MLGMKITYKTVHAILAQKMNKENRVQLNICKIKKLRKDIKYMNNLETSECY